jgi:hypothetical protein
MQAAEGRGLIEAARRRDRLCAFSRRRDGTGSPARDWLAARAFSSEVDAGSREENASKQKMRAPVLIQSEPIRVWLHRRSHLKGTTAMKTIAVLLAAAALALATNAADAKGCLKGAVVGGVAGHYAGHHGVLGAIAGCAYGRHHARQQEQQQQQGKGADVGQTGM